MGRANPRGISWSGSWLCYRLTSSVGHIPLPRGMGEAAWHSQLGSLGGKCSVRARHSSALSQTRLSFPRLCSFPSALAAPGLE